VIAAPIPLQPLPALVRRVCAQRVDYSEYPATCPRLWPSRTAELRSKSLRGPRAWFADFVSVRIGSRRAGFPLDTPEGDTWVGAPQIGVPAAPVASVATVRGQPALVLAAPERVIVVWNADGHGTFVALRRADRPSDEIAAAALRVAESWR
jgi:hypothetical protein